MTSTPPVSAQQRRWKGAGPPPVRFGAGGRGLAPAISRRLSARSRSSSDPVARARSAAHACRPEEPHGLSAGGLSARRALFSRWWAVCTAGSLLPLRTAASESPRSLNISSPGSPGRAGPCVGAESLGGYPPTQRSRPPHPTSTVLPRQGMATPLPAPQSRSSTPWPAMRRLGCTPVRVRPAWRSGRSFGRVPATRRDARFNRQDPPALRRAATRQPESPRTMKR